MTTEEITQKSDEELKDININKETAAAAYTLLFAPILLATRRDSKFISFHAKQGLVLGLIFLLLWWIGSYFSFFRYATIFVLFGAVIGFLQALGGHKYQIPFIYDLAVHGISPQKILAGIKNIFSFTKKIVVGSLPKPVGDKIEDITASPEVKRLQERVAKLEKTVESLLKKHTHK